MSQTTGAPAASQPQHRRRFTRPTVLGALAGALLMMLVLAPIAAAVVMLRCCDDSRGPDPMAWVVLGAVVLVLAAVGAAVGAGIARVIQLLVARLR